MKIWGKIFLSFLIIICILTIIPSNVFEVNAAVSDLVGGMTGEQPKDTLSAGLRTTINSLLGFLQVASGIISVVVIAFTGFQYIIASTPDMKEEIKKKMLPLVIGMVLVFGAASIAKFILGAVEGGTGGTGGAVWL